MTMHPIISSIRGYRGETHPCAVGKRVVVVRVLHGDYALSDDAHASIYTVAGQMSGIRRPTNKRRTG
jgi:hypothetical protein